MFTGSGGASITGTTNTSVALNVGANINLTTAALTIGNTTVNTFANSTIIRVGNSTVFTNISSISITTNGVFSAGGNASIGGDFTVAGNASITGSLLVSGNQTIIGTTLYDADLVPSTNGINLGNTTNRWQLFANSGTFTTGISVATGNTNFNSGILFVDATNSRVGVSNTNPGSKLSISGGNVAITTVGSGIVFPDSSFLSTAVVVAGSDTQVQFNDAGVLGAAAGFVYNKSTNNATVANNFIATRGLISNTVTLNSVSHSVTSSFSFSSTAEATVDTFSVSTYRSADYSIQMTDTTTNSYSIARILVVHNGSEPYSTQFGSISTNNTLCAFRTTISGGNINLLGTPTTSTVSVKIHKVLITV